MTIRLLPACALLLALGASLPLTAQDAPAYLSQHRSTAPDNRAIRQLLTAYTTSVTRGDEAAFEALLLDPRIPFMSLQNLDGKGAQDAHPDTSDYASFRQGIFRSGTHYVQHFYNVHIEQDGKLAQVSLDFVTQVAGTHDGGYGFKTLQLLKVDGHWKIASEFYTAYALPKSS